MNVYGVWLVSMTCTSQVHAPNRRMIRCQVMGQTGPAAAPCTVQCSNPFYTEKWPISAKMQIIIMRTELWTGTQGVSEESLGNFELFRQRKEIECLLYLIDLIWPKQKYKCPFWDIMADSLNITPCYPHNRIVTLLQQMSFEKKSLDFYSEDFGRSM